MWFRGVAASMGLCLDFGAILEGHPDVVLAVVVSIVFGSVNSFSHFGLQTLA